MSSPIEPGYGAPFDPDDAPLEDAPLQGAPLQPRQGPPRQGAPQPPPFTDAVGAPIPPLQGALSEKTPRWVVWFFVALGCLPFAACATCTCAGVAVGVHLAH
jgi:hypothetical protein